MVSCFLAAEILARSASCWSRRSRHWLDGWGAGVSVGGFGEGGMGEKG